MPSEYDNNLLREAILHFKARDFSLARRYLERALENADDPRTRAGAAFYLSQVSDDPLEKRKWLEETLANDPVNAEARRALAILDGKLKPDEIINPDALPEPQAGAQSVRADRFTCPKCGGRMVYAADGHSLVCEYCTRTQTLQANTGSSEQDFFVAMASGKGHRTPVATQVFACKGCGADFLLAPQVLTAVCAYCGSPHVIARDRRDLAQPDAILPMAITQQQAAWALVRWAEENRIQPQGKVQAPRGLYLPVWVFNIMGNIPWSGRVVRNKREVAISGDEQVLYADICVPGSRKLSGLLAKILPEYDFSTAPAYDSRYLVGWPAEVYEIAMSDAALEARSQVVERVRHDVRAEHGHVLDLNYSASAIAVDSFKLALVPLWMTEYMSEDKTYRLVINGVSGAVLGETPARGLLGWLGDLLGSQPRT